MTAKTSEIAYWRALLIGSGTRWNLKNLQDIVMPLTQLVVDGGPAEHYAFHFSVSEISGVISNDGSGEMRVPYEKELIFGCTESSYAQSKMSPRRDFTSEEW